jgi:hypothetical protein
VVTWSRHWSICWAKLTGSIPFQTLLPFRSTVGNTICRIKTLTSGWKTFHWWRRATKRLLCCGFWRTGKAMGQVCQCLVEDMTRNKCFFFPGWFTFYTYLWPVCMSGNVNLLAIITLRTSQGFWWANLNIQGVLKVALVTLDSCSRNKVLYLQPNANSINTPTTQQLIEKSATVAAIFFSWGAVWVHLLRRPLTDLLYRPRTIEDEGGAVGGMRIGRGNKSNPRKPSPVSLGPSQIPHDLIWARTLAAALGSRQLTAELWHGHWPQCYHLLQVTNWKQVKIITVKRKTTFRAPGIFSCSSEFTCRSSSICCLTKPQLFYSTDWNFDTLTWGGGGASERVCLWVGDCVLQVNRSS